MSLFNCIVMSDFLWLCGLQHARFPCHSLSPGLLKLMSIESVMPYNHLIICHPLFASCGQNTGALVQSFQITQGWFPLGMTGLIPCSSRVSDESYLAPQFWKHQFFSAKSSLWSKYHICTWLLKKIVVLTTTWTFFSKVMSLLFNSVFRFVITFHPRNKRSLFPWL